MLWDARFSLFCVDKLKYMGQSMSVLDILALELVGGSSMAVLVLVPHTRAIPVVPKYKQGSRSIKSRIIIKINNIIYINIPVIYSTITLGILGSIVMPRRTRTILIVC